MTTRRLLFWLVALSCLAAATPALAGPWTKDAGKYYVKLSQSLYLATSFVNASGQLQEGVSYTGATTAVYAEVGVFEQLHLQAYLPYVVAISTDSDGERFVRGGAGDAVVGLQYGLPIGVFPMAARATLKMPMYARDSSLSARPFPVAGDGQIDATLWLSGGASIEALSAWSFVELGYQLRTEEYIGDDPISPRSYANTVRANGQFGHHLSEWVMLAANLELAMPLDNDSFTKGFFAAGAGVFIKWAKDSPWAIEANLDRTFWARNSALGTSLGLGLSHQH